VVRGTHNLRSSVTPVKAWATARAMAKAVAAMAYRLVLVLEALA
jgi:hypothetical protein